MHTRKLQSGSAVNFHYGTAVSLYRIERLPPAVLVSLRSTSVTHVQNWAAHLADTTRLLKCGTTVATMS